LFDFLFKPLRSALDLAGRDVTEPLVRTEEEMVDAADALRHASQSIERHVEVIEGLATSVGPLRDSVVQLTVTMNALVDVLAPLAAAERGMHNVEHDVEHVERGIGHIFGRHRHDKPADAPARAPADPAE
jgi:hypothetical protein